MKVLVTGATGFVGREILAQLQGAGHSIRIFARNPLDARVTELAVRFRAEVHPGDVLEADSVSAALVGMDAVIHLVGIISEVGRQTWENIHVNGTRHVVAAAKLSGVHRLVQMSALGTRPGAVSRYHQSKWAAEEIVRQSGLDFTIFRPSLIYGPHDHFVNLFAKIIRFSPVVPLMGRAEAKLQPVEVKVVASAFVRCLTEPGASGRTFDLAGPETFTLGDLIETIQTVMGRRRLRLRVPMALARAQVALFEFIFPRLLRRAPPLNRDQLIMLGEDNIGDSAPAVKLFKLERSSLRAGISRYLIT